MEKSVRNSGSSPEKIIEKETSWSREKAFCKRNILQKKREEITKGYN